MGDQDPGIDGGQAIIRRKSSADGFQCRADDLVSFVRSAGHDEGPLSAPSSPPEVLHLAFDQQVERTECLILSNTSVVAASALASPTRCRIRIPLLQVPGPFERGYERLRGFTRYKVPRARTRRSAPDSVLERL